MSQKFNVQSRLKVFDTIIVRAPPTFPLLWHALHYKSAQLQYAVYQRYYALHW
jgi:hypothetical protein